MKIFLSFLQGNPHHPIPAYSFWEFYIKNGLLEGNHEISELKNGDWAYGLVPQSNESFKNWKSNIWEQSLTHLRANPCDLFLSYLYPNQIDEVAIKEIKKLGIPCVNFFCDHIREYKKIPEEFSVFDLNWVPEYKALDLYKKAGYSFIYLPMPMWVEPKFRTVSQAWTNQIAFIGSHDIQRQLFFEELLKIEPDFPIDIYGNGWQENNYIAPITALKPNFKQKINTQFNFLSRHGISSYLRKIKYRNYKPSFSPTLISHLKPTPSFSDYVNLTRDSLITVGSNRYPSFDYPLYKPNTYSRLRDIEAPMLGACYLTEWTDGLDTLYEIGKEIETYKTTTELIEKAKELSKNKEKQIKLRTLGQQKAIQNLSIIQSISKIEAFFR